jgi:hypothetical protein
MRPASSAKLASLALALLLPLTPRPAHSQASEIPSAQAPHLDTETADKRGRALLAQMVEALGGDTWLNRRDMVVRGHTAAFFHGAPSGMVVEYSGARQFPVDGRPEAERIGFITEKSMILPGHKIDVVQIYTQGKGYEVTYKGKTPLPADLVEDYNRRMHHSIESVITDWMKKPDVMVIDEGTSMVERRLAHKVTVLAADNDAVTIEVDANTHLPLRRSYETRNEKFKDIDKDVEEYDDYHTIQGLPTAMTLTRYHDDDMSSQRFYSTVEYNRGLDPALFNPDNLLPSSKQKKP